MVLTMSRVSNGTSRFILETATSVQEFVLDSPISQNDEVNKTVMLAKGRQHG